MATAPPRLLAISDRRQLGGRGHGDGDGNGEDALEAWLAALAESPVDAVQIREKDLSDRELLTWVERARAILPPRIALVVNRRADVALAAGADGVHLPSDALPIAELRRRFGGDFLLGASAHHVEEVERAAAAGADYVTFGPVWETPSKAAYGPPPGLAALRRAARVGLPVLALGGVTIARAPEAAAAGAAGVAAIRMFLDPRDPALGPLASLFGDRENQP